MNTSFLISWQSVARSPRPAREHRSFAARVARTILALLLAVPVLAGAAADSAKFTFQLPAEAAEVALKRFSEQSGRQVVFPSDVAQGIRTSAVRGEFTPAEALTKMLAGTPLRAVLNERTGAWAIVREESTGPNAVRAAQPSGRPAQNTVSSASANSDQAVELSPFVVNEESDSGWLATSTLAGSRMNTPLRDTGASISVMTSEFLRDIGAIGLEDVVGYAVNIHMSGSEGPSPDQNPSMFNYDAAQVRIRGVPATVTRNYFRWEMQADTYNADRIEENRGPNSILFGIGSAGGVVNTLTKRANLSRNFRRASVMAGNDDSHRATMDVNQRALDGKLALRLNAVNSNLGNYRHHAFTDTRRIHLAGTWQARENTQFRIDYEIGEIESVGVRAAPSYDGVTSWLAAGSPTFSTVQTASLGPNGITRYATNAQRITFIENTGGVYNYQGQNRATGDNLVVLNPGLIDYSVNTTGPYNRRDANLQALSVFLEHRFGRNTFAELSHNLQMSNRDVWVNGQGRAENATIYADPHQFLPNGEPNPFAGRLMYEGSRWNTSISRVKTHNTRLMLSHERDFGRWGDYRVAVMGEHEWRKQIDRNWVEVWEGAPFSSVPETEANQVWRRNYVTPGDWSTYNAGPGPRNGLLRNVPDPTTPGRMLNSTWVPFNQGGQRDPVEHQNTVLVGGHARYLSGRVVLGFGFRRDELDLRINQAVRDPATNVWTVDHPGVVRQHESHSGDTKTLGAVVHPTRHISLFYNFSNSINVPNTSHRILPDGRTAPNSEASGEDFGIRLTFFDGRLSARINRYTVDMIGATGGGFGGTVDNPTVLNDRVLNALSAAGLITPQERDARDFTTNQATLDRKLEGYEFNMTGAVTKNWSISANYAYSDGFDANVGPEVKAWMVEALPWYRQYSDVLTGVAGSNGQLMTVGQLVSMWEADVQRLHFAREGDLILGNRKHKFNVFTRYTLSRGPLKGLAIGGGYRYQGKAPTQIGNNDTLFYSEPQGNTDAFLSYRLRVPRLLKTPVTLQLNVRNVLDETDPRITTWNTDGTRIRSAVIVEPRSWRFTASFEF
jgi:iron complex outermembrane recepter protein